jgi:tRNA-splicing ligase RtcB
MSNIKVYGKHEPKTLAQMRTLHDDRQRREGRAMRGRPSRLRPSDRLSPSAVSASTSRAGTWPSGSMRITPTSRRAPRPFSTTSAGRSASVGQHNAVKVDHELFDSPLWDAAGVANLKEMARNQLGTVGSGNH